LAEPTGSEPHSKGVDFTALGRRGPSTFASETIPMAMPAATASTIPMGKYT